MAIFYSTATVQRDANINIYYLLFRGLLLAAKRLGHEDTFYWIASDGWGKQQQVAHSSIPVAFKHDFITLNILCLKDLIFAFDKECF